jgi:hypothetical protein
MSADGRPVFLGDIGVDLDRQRALLVEPVEPVLART